MITNSLYALGFLPVPSPNYTYIIRTPFLHPISPFIYSKKGDCGVLEFMKMSSFTELTSDVETKSFPKSKLVSE